MSRALSLAKKSLAKALYSLTLSVRYSPHLSPELSVRKIFLIKTGVLLRFIVDTLLSLNSDMGSLKGIRKFSKLKRDCSVIVIANGPSAKTLNLEKVKEYKLSGELEVFAINFSVLELKYEEITDYLVLSDPGMHPKSESARALDLWEKIRKQSSIKLITPSSWHRYLADTICKTLGCLHFKDTSLEGFTRNINPTRGRGYASLTAYKALAVALFFRYQKTFVIGMDNSMFRKILVDENNRLIQDSNHGAGIYPVSEDFSEHFSGGIYDYFYALSEAFRSLKFCFGKHPVVNLGLESEVDCFDKVKKTDPFYDLLIR
jgi:hypothetical protein